MDISIICIGKLKEAYWRDACAEYSKRLTSFCRFDIVELPEYRCSSEPSDAEITEVIEQEGRRILEKCGNGDYVVAMCVEGKLITSEQLAQCVSAQMLSGNSRVSFVIGGSYGLSDAVKSRAQLRISMGRMTFPHQLARVMLCEQIYRASMIIQRRKYHK